MADIKAIAEEVVNLTVKEVNELAEVLKEEYGIDLEELYFNQKTNITFSGNSFQTSLIGHNFKPYIGHKPPGWESLYKEKERWKKISKNTNLLK